MKVVVTGTRGIPDIMGGVETHCEQLFPRLAAKGVDVTVIRRSSYAQDGLSQWKGVNLVDIPCPRKKSLEAIVHSIKAVNMAKKLGADLLHVHAIGPALVVPYAKLRGLKVVFTHHGPDYDREKWGFFAKTMLRLGESLGCRFADAVIAISSVIRNLLLQKYGRRYGLGEKIHLIYNGVPKASICDAPEYFKELGIEEGKYVLGMCRFVPEKRLHDLVEAFSLLRNAGKIAPEVKLVLAGDADFDDDYSLSLKKMAADAGVVLTGFVKGQKLHSLLSHCACYVLPSSHEGLPIALLEAMSFSAPVVVSDIPANLEVGLDADSYFHCGDVQDLADKLQQKLDGGVKKVEYDMSRYDWDTISSQLYSIYTSVH